MPPVAVVKRLSNTDMQRRRADALAEVRLTEDELREKALRYDLSPKELAALQEIEDLDYLLAHADAR